MRLSAISLGFMLIFTYSISCNFSCCWCKTPTHKLKRRFIWFSWLAPRQSSVSERHCGGETVYGRAGSREDTASNRRATDLLSLLTLLDYKPFGWCHPYTGWDLPLSTPTTVINQLIDSSSTTQPGSQYHTPDPHSHTLNPLTSEKPQLWTHETWWGGGACLNQAIIHHFKFLKSKTCSLLV